jgi:hypothetical protein
VADLQVVGGETLPRCVHHWILGDPSGGFVMGRCKRCNATRAYPAHPDSNDRFDDYRELTASRSYGERLSA